MVCRMWQDQTELHLEEAKADEFELRPKLRVLVANEPRLYREGIAATLRDLKPDVDVLVVEPEALDREVGRSVADMVLCSHVTPVVKNEALVSIEFYLEGKPLMGVNVDGLSLRAIDDGLPTLLSLVDRTELLAYGG